jgi:hypothetical protein
MKETVDRIVEKEGPNGLIITKAFYGKIDKKNGPAFETSEKVVDVQIPLQFLVKDRSLQIVSDQTKVFKLIYISSFFYHCIYVQCLLF